jgi:hypothetical protein
MLLFEVEGELLPEVEGELPVELVALPVVLGEDELPLVLG